MRDGHQHALGPVTTIHRRHARGPGLAAADQAEFTSSSVTSLCATGAAGIRTVRVAPHERGETMIHIVVRAGDYVRHAYHLPSAHPRDGASSYVPLPQDDEGGE